MNTVRAARTPIWEKQKSKKKRARIIRLAIFIVILFVLVNLVIKLPGVYKDLNTPFPQLPRTEERNFSVDVSFRTNILLVSFEDENRLVDTAIATYEPVDKKLSVVFFDLGELKKLRIKTNNVFRNQGIDGLEQFVTSGLGVPIDGYLAFEDPTLRFDSKNTAAAVESMKSVVAPFKLISAKGDLNNTLKTDLTSGQLLKLVFVVRGANYSEDNNFSLTDRDTGNLQTEKIDDLIAGLFFDQKVLQEGAAITIVNASQVIGVGSTLGRYLTNLGANVVGIEAQESVSKETRLIVQNEKPEVTKRLESILKFKKERARDEDQFPGDIQIIIGRDEAEKLTLP
ncbi:MAG: LytR C-terminal domain-containing protein [Candidatus Woykebacteria bacterium]